MGKASRVRKETTQQKLAARRAAARRASRRRQWLLTLGSTAAVIAVVAVLILVKVLSAPPPNKPEPVDGTLLPASVAHEVTGVPASTLNAVGGGLANQMMAAEPKPLQPMTGEPPLRGNGKPEMLYIGAEFCPFCAAMRWSMAVALGRFGQFSPLRGIHSSSSDSDPDTATLTFYRSHFTSRYLTFTPVENETRTHAPLQNPTAAETVLWNKYEANSYPFIDIGNKYWLSYLYDPAILAGKTWSQIAAALHDPASPIAQGVGGTANYLTAALCTATGGQPRSVCGSRAVTAVRGNL